jgi:hypothetical protein
MNAEREYREGDNFRSPVTGHFLTVVRCEACGHLYAGEFDRTGMGEQCPCANGECEECMTDREKAFFLNGVAFFAASISNGDHDAAFISLQARLLVALDIPASMINELVPEVHRTLDAGGFRGPRKEAN